ncbi:hypothetical protein GOBAR_AA26713 [Gossypium barbadense]|uniref:Uncharacterized protein n=1 Tax=Gossypium barbadense TaxID=3634 RepID=A0A2P5WS86_GOSBA|nr:hypothetical protein GOBAR_AA26713 [Gossypium barbadense]
MESKKVLGAHKFFSVKPHSRAELRNAHVAYQPTKSKTDAGLDDGKESVPRSCSNEGANLIRVADLDRCARSREKGGGLRLELVWLGAREDDAKVSGVRIEEGEREEESLRGCEGVRCGRRKGGRRRKVEGGANGNRIG